MPSTQPPTPPDWSPDSWRAKLHAQQIVYPDRAAVDAAVARLRLLPPLVTSWEIERLKSQIAQAQEGTRFLLQGGDCAERIEDCRPELIAGKLKILMQMSVVLVYAGKRPVIRVGRFAGQYAKPRSSPTETRTIDGKPVTLPSYSGDLVNREPFTPDARRPDPQRMLDGYTHAAMTLNFVRALMDGGFADIHHPEYWDLGFMRHAGLPAELRAEYQRMIDRLSEGLRFMEAVGERTVEELTSAEFFTSHEGLNLLYESAQTRTVPRRTGWYNLSTHMPWLGDRTRDPDGAHVEYFRGIRNPIGIKLGPGTPPVHGGSAHTPAADLPRLLRTLNPTREKGKIVLIARLGARHVRAHLPELIKRVQDDTREGGPGPVLWACDPMHGNAATTANGTKTRSFAEITDELEASWDIHQHLGSRLGGVHFELTGEDVTECLGGARGLNEADLARNYQSPCDPRLNYEQSLELAFLLARKMQRSATDTRPG
jgi:3-deoxy-7-phosphoheptulonate synthase